MVVLISLDTNGSCYNTCCPDYLSPVLGSSTKLGTYYSLVTSATELHIQLGFQSQSIPCKNPRSTTLLKQLILNGEHQGFILTVIARSLGFLPLFMLSISHAQCCTCYFSYRSTQIKTYSWDNAQVILVGNKCDMEDERVISTERGQHLGEQLGKTQVKKRESFIIDTLNRVIGVCVCVR